MPLLQTLLDDHRSGAHDLGNQLREVQTITWHFATDNHKSGKHREALQLVSRLSACKTGLSQAAMGTILNLRALSHSHLGEHEHAKQSATEAALEARQPMLGVSPDPALKLVLVLTPNVQNWPSPSPCACT